MRFRAVVLTGCFCLALLGAASGASAQSALPNGYTMPEAQFNSYYSRGPTIDLVRYTDSDTHFCQGYPVNLIDPATGAVTCADDDTEYGYSVGCYLGSLKVEVIAGGKLASFTGLKDCALLPRSRSSCYDSDDDCSFTGRAHTATITVRSCGYLVGEAMYEDYVEGYCLGIPRTKANAKKRRVSTVASWKVSLNGVSIGAGRVRVTTTYKPGGPYFESIRAKQKPQTDYFYCPYDYASRSRPKPYFDGRRPWPRLYCKYRRGNYTGTWTDKATYLSGS